MKTLAWQVAMITVLASFAGMFEKAAAHSIEAQGSFTVEVHNDARIDSKELADAERVAGTVFKKAGVASRWMEAGTVSEKQSSDGTDDPTSLAHLRVYILSGATADSLALPDGVMGVAPGIGPDRQFVYIFYDRVKELVQRRETAQALDARISLCTGQILGEVMAHEIGHILLNLPSHSATGIMRGPWNRRDLQDAAYGQSLFTPEQAKVIRTEVARRDSQPQSWQAANFDRAF
jgi:hypothetical protein